MNVPHDVWIWVEKPVTSSKLTVVDELIDATVLNTADAVKISRKANQEHAKYLWRLVPIRKSGTFVVQGNPRPGLQAN